MSRKKDVLACIEHLEARHNERLGNLEEDMNCVLQALDISGHNNKTTMGMLRYIATHNYTSIIDVILKKLGYRRAYEGELISTTIVKLGKGKSHARKR